MIFFASTTRNSTIINIGAKENERGIDILAKKGLLWQQSSLLYTLYVFARNQTHKTTHDASEKRREQKFLSIEDEWKEEKKKS